jgi:putative DNA primase/helicase
MAGTTVEPMTKQKKESTLLAHDGLPMDDSANAKRLEKVSGDRLRYVHAWGKFLVWRKDGLWSTDYKEALATELAKGVSVEFRKALPPFNPEDAVSVMEHQWSKQMAQRGGLAAMLNTFRAMVLIDHEQLDSEPELLNVKNGTIDLRTAELLDHDRFDFITQQSLVEYDPDAECPTWEECLERWQPDPEIRHYLQVRAGACATGLATETLDIDFGSGANGKSKFHGAIQHVLGEYAVVPHKSLIVTQKHEQHPTNIAALFRKRLAVTSETKSADSLDEERVKSITGSDKLTGRRMREDFWDFYPSHTLIIHTNYKPKIRGTDEAIWRRVRLVPWEVTIPENERDEFLAAKLEAEAPGILRWVVEGAHEFLAKGITVPDSIRAATDDYRQGEDLIGQFLAEMVEVTKDADDVENFSDIQQAVTEWSESEGLKWALSLNQLTDALEARGAWRGARVRVHAITKTYQTTAWHGLRLGPFED